MAPLPLPTELIIEIATQLDAPSLVRFKSVRASFPSPPSPSSPSVLLLLLPGANLVHLRLNSQQHQTCKIFRDIVSQTPSLQYALALAAHGLCDGPPSRVAALSRLALVEAYEEAWRTFSWSEHLTLELPPPHEAPYVSGGALVLPICEAGGGEVRSFVVQSIPSALRGIQERHWRIDFDFVAMCFIIDATQDLLAVVPRNDKTTLALSCKLSHAHILTRVTMQRPCARAVYWSATLPLCE